MKDSCTIEPSGDKFWFVNDDLHREDGPACEYVNGNKCWYQNGKYHRVDGPAIELSNGIKQWWYRGKQIKCSYQQEFERLIKLKAFW
jgi:hypothetical protein